MEKLKRYRAVLTPDFSVYREMAPVMQLYNTFRNRWCGAYFASKGIRVIPSISWGDENTFDFCFEGVSKGSVVAVSTYMVSEHNNRSDQKEFFLKGYNELLRRIEPEKIICYNEPFPEMQGDIVFVDYDLSSWRYMNDDPYVPSKYVSYITGERPLPTNSKIIIKSGLVIRDDVLLKGIGSAYGAKWKPNPSKPQDLVFKGQPNTIQGIFLPTKKGGFWVIAKYDSNGNAILVRHETEHAPGSGHSNPHDHIINWNNPDKHPQQGKPINYPDNKIPEFKSFHIGDARRMSVYNLDNIYSFHTISEFKMSMRYGAEVVIEWGGKEYGIWSEEGIIRITCTNEPEKESIFSTSDDALEYVLGNDRLRDVITQVTVVERTI
ncbi:MAG: DUF4417 domain-containing protein [Ruminococcaceae bacterium]|nr:DUF4417 domain-containing protein [Oscillospiraceae bacterium]